MNVPSGSLSNWLSFSVDLASLWVACTALLVSVLTLGVALYALNRWTTELRLASLYKIATEIDAAALDLDRAFRAARSQQIRASDLTPYFEGGDPDVPTLAQYGNAYNAIFAARWGRLASAISALRSLQSWADVHQMTAVSAKIQSVADIASSLKHEIDRVRERFDNPVVSDAEHKNILGLWVNPTVRYVLSDDPTEKLNADFASELGQLRIEIRKAGIGLLPGEGITRPDPALDLDNHQH